MSLVIPEALEPVFIGDTVINVDSTIGFPESGTLISGQNKITYTSKSINQFLDALVLTFQ